MKARHIISASILWIGLTLIGCTGKGVDIPRIAPDLFNSEDTLTLGLRRLDAEFYRVPAPEGYANNVLFTRFNGEYYCMWQYSRKDEDSPDTQVLYTTSQDALLWTKPKILAGPTDTSFPSPGGWVQRGDSLSAVINRFSVSGGGSASYVTTRGMGIWGKEHSITMSDGTPLDGILEQDPLLLPSGRTVGAAHFGKDLTVCPIYTDDPSGLRGWKKAALPQGEGKPLEPSLYTSKGGSLVMLFRDQASSFKKLASISHDGGESWSAPVATDIPDSRSKQCAGNLPDGRSFWVGNPTGNKSRRILVLALSSDGTVFDKAWLLAGPEDLPARRNEGKYKTLGYNYPKAIVLDNDLWVSLSINKEDVTLVRIPISSL